MKVAGEASWCQGRSFPWWMCVVLITLLFPWKVISFSALPAFSWRHRRNYQWRNSGDSVLACLPSHKKAKQHKGKVKYDLESLNIENRVPLTVKRENGEVMQESKGSLFVPKKKPDLQTQLQYARNGHAVIRQFLPIDPLHKLRQMLLHFGNEQELSTWRQKVAVAAQDAADPILAAKWVASCHSVADCQALLQRLLQSKDPVALPFLQYFNTWRRYAEVYALAQSLAESATILLDVPSVRLYQDALFWKRPVDGPTPWHTDARMAPFDTSHILTFWIPLQPVRSSGGGLVFCSKSHSDFALPYWNDVSEASANPSSPWNSLEERYRAEESCCDYMPLSVGDVTVHSGWTLHCADASNGDDRLALAITYVDAWAPVRKTLVSPMKSDGEDVWSYQDWVKEVPHNTQRWNHPHVPILWPPPSSKEVNTGIKQRKRRI